MAYRTTCPTTASVWHVTRSFTRKHKLIGVWTLVAALLFQQSAFAGLSAPPARGGNSPESELAEAGSVFADSVSGTKIVRVTDSRDGRATLETGSNRSSFNLDSSRFILTLDGVANLYAFDASSLRIQKIGPLFNAAALRSDSWHWSAKEAGTIIGLESTDSPRIYAYDTRSGNRTVLKDFSGVLPGGEALQLSKSRVDDSHFAFSWRESGSAVRSVVVWERETDNIYICSTSPIPSAASRASQKRTSTDPAMRS